MYLLKINPNLPQAWFGHYLNRVDRDRSLYLPTQENKEKREGRKTRERRYSQCMNSLSLQKMEKARR